MHTNLQALSTAQAAPVSKTSALPPSAEFFHKVTDRIRHKRHQEHMYSAQSA